MLQIAEVVGHFRATRVIVNAVRSKRLFMDDDRRIRLLADAVANLEAVVRDLAYKDMVSRGFGAHATMLRELETEVPYETE